jgi:hypothetical protein
VEFALVNRLTAKPGQRHRVVEILLESGKLFDPSSAEECMPLLEGLPEQMRVLPVGAKVPGG